ncbi:MAG: helix-turn-helix domain-containing protein [Phycisphaerales bacterium]
MRESKRILLRTALFELGVFRSVAARSGEVRQSIALSHLVAFPRTASLLRRAGEPVQLATPVGAVFYNHGCEYAATAVGTETEITHFLRIASPVLRDAIRPFDPAVAEREEQPFTLAGGPLSDRAYFFHAAIARAAAAHAIDNLAADEALSNLVHETVGWAYAQRTVKRVEKLGARDTDYVRWTQEILSRQFRSAHGLEYLAARVGVSPFYLCRVFKRVAGMTIHEFRDRLRLRAALEEMAETRDDLALIAVRAGYSSQSHFTDAFRGRFGMPPAKGRALLRSGMLRHAI